MKLDRKVANLERGIVITPSYVSNGHWLIRRTLIDNSELLNYRDDEIFTALTTTAQRRARWLPQDIRRETDDDYAIRVIPRESGITAVLTDWTFDNGYTNYRLVISECGRFCSAVQVAYIPVLCPMESWAGKRESIQPMPLFIYSGGAAGGEARDGAIPCMVMPLVPDLPSWITLRSLVNVRGEEFRSAYAEAIAPAG